MVKRKRLLVSAHFIMDCLPPAELMFSAVDDGNNLRFLSVFDQGNAFVGINGSAAVHPEMHQHNVPRIRIRDHPDQSRKHFMLDIHIGFFFDVR